LLALLHQTFQISGQTFRKFLEVENPSRDNSFKQFTLGSDQRLPQLNLVPILPWHALIIIPIKEYVEFQKISPSLDPLKLFFLSLSVKVSDLGLLFFPRSIFCLNWIFSRFALG
jgi:hypothetical protein